jgi:flagellar export protein FliJ
MEDFKLEPVLRYRRSVEDARRKAFAEKRERLSAEEEALEALVARRQKHLRELGGKLEQGLSVSENVLYVDYLARMDDEMGARKKAVYAAEEAAEIERGRLIEAVRHRKSLERLKKKHLAAREKEIFRKEMHRLDEIAVNRFNRARLRGSGGG